MNRQSRDYFVHIPKTGGSSVRTLITLNYLESERLNLYGTQPEIFNACQQAKRHGLDPHFIQGHMPVGVHHYFNDSAPNYYFFLREPVARTLSDISHCMRNPKHGFYHILGDPQLDMQQRLSLAKDIIYYRNNMTHYLSEVFFAAEVGLPDLHRAIDRVWKSPFVGITEQSEKSLLIMAKKLGWKYVIPQKMNVSKQPPAIPVEDTRQACESFLTFDIELYQIALERFELLVNSYGGLLDEATEELLMLIERQGVEHPQLQQSTYLVGDALTVPVADIATNLSKDSPLRRWIAS